MKKERRQAEGCSSVLSGPSKEQSPEHLHRSGTDVDYLIILDYDCPVCHRTTQHMQTDIHTLILCAHMDSMVCRVKQ